MTSRTRRHIVLGLFLMTACAPTDKRVANVACIDQPSIRSQQLCYAWQEELFERVTTNLRANAAKFGTDSIVVRREVEEMGLRLLECGAAPDTTARPRQAMLSVWQCRDRLYKQQIATRVIPSEASGTAPPPSEGSGGGPPHPI
jgi:hypothetical protein